MRDVQAIISDIQSLQTGDLTEKKLANLADELNEHPKAAKTIRFVLELFERYPNEDFGLPGPLAHFIERYYGTGYEKELELSLRRQPTVLTLRLGNRIVNAQDSNSVQFIELLAEIAGRTDLEESIRIEAQPFVDNYRLRIDPQGSIG